MFQHRPSDFGGFRVVDRRDHRGKLLAKRGPWQHRSHRARLRGVRCAGSTEKNDRREEAETLGRQGSVMGGKRTLTGMLRNAPLLDQGYDDSVMYYGGR